MGIHSSQSDAEFMRALADNLEREGWGNTTIPAELRRRGARMTDKPSVAAVLRWDNKS